MVAKEELSKACQEKPSKKINLTSIRFDWYQSEDKITWFLYVKNAIQESIKLECHDQNCVVFFKTADKLFLSQHHAEPNDLFEWNVDLNDKIVPEKCIFKSSNTSIELNLFAKSNKKWKTLIKEEKIEQNFTKQAQNRSPSSSRSPSPQPKSVQTSTSTNYGFIGLANLGNTCYMNAALQFLANATDLRDYFCKIL